MPDIEIFGPVSAGEITAALKDAPYAGELAFIRSSKNVTDITGRSVSFVRVSCSVAFPVESLDDIVKRLRPIVGVETNDFASWYPQELAVADSSEPSTGA